MKPIWSSEGSRPLQRRSDRRNARLRGHGFIGGPILWGRTAATGALEAALAAAALVNPADYADAGHRILVASNDRDRFLVSRDTPLGEHAPDESERATDSRGRTCVRCSRPSPWREHGATRVMRRSRPWEARWTVWPSSDAATRSACAGRSCGLAEQRAGDLSAPHVSPAAARPTRRCGP